MSDVFKSADALRTLQESLHIIAQQVELDLSYATPCKKVYQRYKVYGQMHMDKMKAWGE